MGEPAIPTEADRATTRAKAARIVDNVRNDEGMFDGVDILKTDRAWPSAATKGIGLLAFELAHEVVLLRAQLAGRRALDEQCDHHEKLTAQFTVRCTKAKGHELHAGSVDL